MADTHVVRQQSQMTPETADKPFAPVAAVFLAAGLGAVVLGVLTTLSEASTGIGDALNWFNSVGPLSGKTIISCAVFFVAWAILGVVLKGKEPAPDKVFIWTGVLVVIGLVLTFPTFFQLFAPAE